MQLLKSLRPGEKKIIRESVVDVLAIAGIGIPVLLILKLAVPIRSIPSGSMEPTLMSGDIVLVNNMRYFREPPRRGDMVAFDSGFRAGLFNKEQVRFVKRVVGLPGEELYISHGKVYINGSLLQEPYTVGSQKDIALVKVPDDAYFLMGDNREHSYDSRYLGPIPAGHIQGKISAIVWPPNNLAEF